MTIELRNSDRLPAPAGFSHAAIAPPGQTVYLAGTIGTDAEGNFADGLAGQTTQALINMVDALIGVGGGVNDLAKIVVYVVGWRESMQRELFAGIGAAAQVNPLPLIPITLVGVQSLFLDAALVEIEGTAVIAPRHTEV
ncbi:RidA family protein [Ilumatobacter sp.]|uniref:RidA family protein n=1 Tax=Ilumatobacter sp. TaxID=1967498 RepID=UPI00375260E0